MLTPKEVDAKIAYAQGLLGTNPGVNEIEVTQEWLSDFRIAVVELSILYGRIKAEYAKHEIYVITQPDYDKVKAKLKLAAHIAAHIDSTFPYLEQMHTLKILLEKFFPQVSPEYNTMVSALKKQ